MKPSVVALILLTSTLSLFAQTPSPSILKPDWFSDSASWKFHNGAEFPPAAKGGFQISDYSGGKAAEVEFNFTEGGKYVSITRKISIESGYTEMRFSFKANAVCKILLRLYDRDGECFQYLIPYTTIHEVKNNRISFAEKPQFIYGGKEKNQTLDYPISSISLGIEKSQNNQGKALFSEIEFVR